MRERPVTVTIFGILNIGFGAMGMLGALMSGLFQHMGAMAPNPGVNSVVAFMDTLHKDPGYTMYMRISVPAEILASLVLITAGIGLLQLRNWARLVSIGYAIYKVLSTFLVVFVLYGALHRVLAETIQKAGGQLVNILIGAMVIGGLIALVLSLAYPALIIFFLTRPKILPAFAPPVPGVEQV